MGCLLPHRPTHWLLLQKKNQKTKCWAEKCLFYGPWLQKAVFRTAHRDKAIELDVWPQCKDRCRDMRTWISISVDTSISESMKSSFTLLELVSVQDLFWCGQNLQCCGWQDFFLWTTFEFLHWVQQQQQKQWLTTARCLAAAPEGFHLPKLRQKFQGELSWAGLGWNT